MASSLLYRYKDEFVWTGEETSRAVLGLRSGKATLTLYTIHEGHNEPRTRYSEQLALVLGSAKVVSEAEFCVSGTVNGIKLEVQLKTASQHQTQDWVACIDRAIAQTLTPLVEIDFDSLVVSGKKKGPLNRAKGLLVNRN
tara:strand:- start:319 stop:738 length:420 start_codon:yes stop_codon:yes gene_type:complete